MICRIRPTQEKFSALIWGAIDKASRGCVAKFNRASPLSLAANFIIHAKF